MNRALLLKAAGLVTAIAVCAVLVPGCGAPGRNGQNWPADHAGPKVVVSFAPLYCFAASVAGDDAVVKNVMTSKGPHDFDPTADDIALVSQADLFFVVGLGLDEKKAEVMRSGSGNKNMKIIELGEKLDKKDLCEGFCTHADHDADHKHNTDPHVWLSPTHAAKLVGFIRDELKAKDPAHAAGYESRAAAYIEKLNAVKAYGVEKFKDKQDKKLVSFHDSLAYFEECFQLNVRGVLTKKPGQEPSDKEMKELIRICTRKTSPVRVILTEPQYSTSSSGETLRKDLVASGVEDPVLVEFDPLETVRPDELALDWYEKKMRDNIDRLAEKMK
ncbi:metal ABC transporter substrate-binding protein [Gemmata sp. JC717]|uniref:metal ABC transporter substrate-binding protein n=1 Tax=Gemmata algarum TaxID=2975278 RepID=UPI0021BAB737|nr:metal ABC transporter substrate-binding protein [Gemmata algarum]MDY3555333.1 metal ABC transporter substrate-binding protein [Gemmata algarum]